MQRGILQLIRNKSLGSNTLLQRFYSQATSGGIANFNWTPSKVFAAAFASFSTVLYSGYKSFVVQSDASGLVPECLPLQKMKWQHSKMWGTYDHKSLRRGFQVYQEVASACHSLEYIRFRHLVGVVLTEDEAKDLAAESEYIDGPDDEGEMFERPGRLTDPLEKPFANENEARAMNNGAYPPDLSQIVKARHGEEDYIYALLTGYRDPPAGIEVGENMYYNPYFPGGQIAMPPPLAEGMIDFEDGTDASISQLAKDVVSYLAWTARPELNQRHLIGLKALTASLAMTALVGYWKRFVWSTVKNRQVEFFRQTASAIKKRKKNF